MQISEACLCAQQSGTLERVIFALRAVALCATLCVYSVRAEEPSSAKAPSAVDGKKKATQKPTAKRFKPRVVKNEVTEPYSRFATRLFLGAAFGMQNALKYDDKNAYVEHVAPSLGVITCLRFGGVGGICVEWEALQIQLCYSYTEVTQYPDCVTESRKWIFRTGIPKVGVSLCLKQTHVIDMRLWITSFGEKRYIGHELAYAYISRKFGMPHYCGGGSIGVGYNKGHGIVFSMQARLMYTLQL